MTETVVLYLPQCGRCGKLCEKAEYREDLPNRAYHIRYRCHGEEKKYVITDWMFREMSDERKPFVPVEFQPAPVIVAKTLPPDERDRLIDELRAEIEKLRGTPNAITTIPEQQQSTSAAKPAGSTVATLASGRHPTAGTRAEPDAVGIA